MSVVVLEGHATRSRWRRLLAPAATAGVVAATTLALHLRDPHTSGSWGYCPSAALGFWCPGCGGLRAVNDLTRGDLGAAASSNLLLIVVMPLVLLGFAVWTSDRWRGRSRVLPTRLVVGSTYAFCAVAVLFALVRNLPVGAWLAP